GKLGRALDTFAQSLAHFTKINEREGIGNISNNSADIFMLRGEVAEAERRYRAAQVRYREVGMHTYDVAELTQIAMAMRRQGRLIRGELALDGGKSDRVIADARAAADEAAAAGRASDEADARELLARALFAAHQRDAARAAAERAMALTAASELRDQRWRI